MVSDQSHKLARKPREFESLPRNLFSIGIVAQWLAQLTVNQWVVSSSLTIPAMSKKFDVIFPIGISGSGKSFWINNMEKDGYSVICPDDIRRELTGSVSDQSQNSLVFSVAYARMKEILDNGGKVIFDATNVNTKTRRGLEQTIWSFKHDAVIGYKLFDADVDLSFSRIKHDIENGIDRSNVPYDILQKQYENYLKTIQVLSDENIHNVDSVDF